MKAALHKEIKAMAKKQIVRTWRSIAYYDGAQFLTASRISNVTGYDIGVVREICNYHGLTLVG